MVAMASSDNATWLEPRLRIEGAAEGPLKGLTFAAKDLFDVSFTWDAVPPLLLLGPRATTASSAHAALRSAGQGSCDRPWQSHLARDT